MYGLGHVCLCTCIFPSHFSSFLFPSIFSHFIFLLSPHLFLFPPIPSSLFLLLVASLSLFANFRSFLLSLLSIHVYGMVSIDRDYRNHLFVICDSNTFFIIYVKGINNMEREIRILTGLKLEK